MAALIWDAAPAANRPASRPATCLIAARIRQLLNDLAYARFLGGCRAGLLGSGDEPVIWHNGSNPVGHAVSRPC